MVPPSDRCRYKTDKMPTGPFDRKHLLDYLEQKAKEDKDWEEAKPYKKEIRGITDNIFGHGLLRHILPVSMFQHQMCCVTVRCFTANCNVHIWVELCRTACSVTNSCTCSVVSCNIQQY